MGGGRAGVCVIEIVAAHHLIGKQLQRLAGSRHPFEAVVVGQHESHRHLVGFRLGVGQDAPRPAVSSLVVVVVHKHLVNLEVQELGEGGGGDLPWRVQGPPYPSPGRRCQQAPRICCSRLYRRLRGSI